MDMHSYAKRVSKWTNDHKRKLMESRIAYNAIFDSSRYNIDESWRKVVNDANLDDFNISFVRKQWGCLLTKYKNLITRHCGTDELDVETMKMLELEWEFFKPLHQYVSQMQWNWNVHSYAQSPYAEDEIPLPKTIQHNDYTKQNLSTRYEKSKKRVDFKKKYYKHCIRHNRRMEKKFDALLCVFGQMVQSAYPDVDLSKLEDCFNDGSDTEDEDLLYELDYD